MLRHGTLPLATVLAGGRSSRFGGGHKALAELGGKPLVRHVIERLAPQASEVLLSVQQADAKLAALGCELVVDVLQRHRGPLTGLCSGLLRMDGRREDWLLLAPCDAPFLPTDLAPRLLGAVETSGRSVAVARYRGKVQPVFSLWHRNILPAVHTAVLDEGRGGLMSMLDELPHALVDWTDRRRDPFLNINTDADLERARRLLDGECR